MARGKHTQNISSRGSVSKVKLAAGLLSDNVPTSFSNMEWCFQENKDYASMHRKQTKNWGREMQHSSDGGQDNSKSESRSEEETGGQRSLNRNGEQPNEEIKTGGFSIQIKNNEPIIFDDDSVSTLTHYDRRSSRKESGDLSDMLGPFQQASTSRILAAEVAANRIQEGRSVVYNAPSDAEPVEHDSDDKKPNPALSRQEKLTRAKQRFHLKIKDTPSPNCADSVSNSIRSARSESIAQRVAMFEKPVIKNESPMVNKPIQTKKKIFSATQVDCQSDLSTPKPAKPSCPKVSESTGGLSKRPSRKACLKNGTSDRSTRSIASILKSPTADKSEKSTRSVTFVDEDTELGPRKDSSDDIQFSDSNLSANECKRSLSLKYKKSRISKEGRKLRHIKNLNKEQRKSESDFLAGCPFELNFDFDRSDFDLRNFDLSNFGLSMIFGAFDCFGRNRCYDLVSCLIKE